MIARRTSAFVLRRWDTLAIVLLATLMLWPVPFEIPRSQDHTVHLARAWIVGQNLASGHVANWSSVWFFGFPAGELYPVLGDLAVSTVRGLTLWILPWPSCYAIVFWLGYVLAALALGRIARVLGWGPWPGVIAATIFLLDPGETREGGFRFTVFFGVWLQPLAVAWTWWALAELHAALADDAQLGRRLLRPIALVGGALLAHPITLPLLGVMAVPFVLLRPRRTWIRTAITLMIVVAIAFAAAAWFVMPMLAHRAWMATFGALHHDLARMAADAAGGMWATNMSPAVGWTITLGLVWCLWRGDGFARIAAVTSIAAWLLASRDALWIPRLDWLADGFGALQYQRFVMCAKPGFYLCAGVLATAAVRWIWIARGEIRRRVTIAVAAAITTAAICGLSYAMVRHAIEHDVGAAQIGRSADPETTRRFEASWREYLAWAEQKWRERDGFFRFAYETVSRHGHGLADAPVFTGAPAFKIGSTPGETFVHRVESNRARVLDRLRVRYLVSVAATRGEPVARFGTIAVHERTVHEQVARIVGGGEVVVVQDDPEGDGVILDVTGTKADSRLELAIAGYPRWELLHDGRPIEWYEVPVIGKGPIATQQSRREREHVAGPGDRTDPTEPMLLAADAADGRWTLRYRRWLAIDWIAATLAAVAVLAALLLHRRGSSAASWIDRMAARVHPALAALLALAVLAPAMMRWVEHRRSESGLASAWLRSGRASEVEGMHACPLEIERVIGPAACIDADAAQASAIFPGIVVGSDPLSGFIAIDDSSRERRGHATLEVEARNEAGEWITLVREDFGLTRPKREFTATLDPLGAGSIVDVRVRVTDIAVDNARLGFDIVLGPARAAH